MDQMFDAVAAVAKNQSRLEASISAIEAILRILAEAGDIVMAMPNTDGSLREFMRSQGDTMQALHYIFSDAQRMRDILREDIPDLDDLQRIELSVREADVNEFTAALRRGGEISDSDAIDDVLGGDLL